MQSTAPHYLLLTETDHDSADSLLGGRWRFVLEPMSYKFDRCRGDDDRIEVSEREAGVLGERLQLLAVVRGVEALDQPSRITLITSSAYVGKRIRKGFDSWIENGWRWESFGSLKPIKDADLWQRIHAATKIHSIECRLWQFGNRRRTVATPGAEKDSWVRIDDSQDRPRRNYGPTEFEEVQQYDRETSFATASGSRNDQPEFVATRTGWSRVTEIDPDNDQPIQFPQAFGATAW